ncbi:MAG: hypothetical protein EPN70_08580 [Paraburkholderia sp.]|uniref:hypothetical protein n=1 Tax=Paraburkholderia sp. TaxID=1926495 RepID=UPI00121C3387|nr:hypothetical protein [Paraburkholderia sp.]TAM05455.1 MAG: hypothetical protein EPN70_08580 [Paraburkholderia sp.]
MIEQFTPVTTTGSHERRIAIAGTAVLAGRGQNRHADIGFWLKLNNRPVIKHHRVLVVSTIDVFLMSI